MATEPLDLPLCSYDRERIFRPDFPMFRAECKACAVAQLAASPMFHQSGLDGTLAQPYVKALSLIFGDQWRQGHQLVKQQHEALQLARKDIL